MRSLSFVDSAAMDSNRGVPDVSAIGHACGIYRGGVLDSVSGTSCAAPLFGGLVSLINNELVTSGRPRIGFLNPHLCSCPVRSSPVLWSHLGRKFQMLLRHRYSTM